MLGTAAIASATGTRARRCVLRQSSASGSPVLLDVVYPADTQGIERRTGNRTPQHSAHDSKGDLPQNGVDRPAA